MLPDSVAAMNYGDRARVEQIINLWTFSVQSSTDIAPEAYTQFRDAMCAEAQTCGGGEGLLTTLSLPLGEGLGNLIVKGGISLFGKIFGRSGGAAAKGGATVLPSPAQAAQRLREAKPAGAALKSDRWHRSGSFVIDDVAQHGTVSRLVGG